MKKNTQQIVLIALLVTLTTMTIGSGLSVSAQRSGYQRPGYQRGPAGRGANLLRGTYSLDTSRSEDASAVVMRATRGLPSQQQERVRQMLTRRMESPEVLAIDRQGR